MKRSEILEIVKHEIMMCIYSGDGLDEVADNILTAFEKAGMKPPPKKIMIEHNKDMLQGIHAYRDALEWEEEQ